MWRSVDSKLTEGILDMYRKREKKRNSLMVDYSEGTQGTMVVACR
jgi:hypothetical protein